MKNKEPTNFKTINKNELCFEMFVVTSEYFTETIFGQRSSLKAVERNTTEQRFVLHGYHRIVKRL